MTSLPRTRADASVGAASPAERRAAVRSAGAMSPDSVFMRVSLWPNLRPVWVARRYRNACANCTHCGVITRKCLCRHGFGPRWLARAALLPDGPLRTCWTPAAMSGMIDDD